MFTKKTKGKCGDSHCVAARVFTQASATALWCLFPLCLCQTATIIIWLKAPRPLPSFVLAWLECGARLSQTLMSHGTRLRAKSTPQARQTRDLQRPDPWGRCAPLAAPWRGAWQLPWPRRLEPPAPASMMKNRTHFLAKLTFREFCDFDSGDKWGVSINE